MGELYVNRKYLRHCNVRDDPLQASELNLFDVKHQVSYSNWNSKDRKLGGISHGGLRTYSTQQQLIP